MIIVGNTLVSLSVLEEEFVCNLGACKGACCVEGESGAPLNEDELTIISDNLDAIRPYMTEKGRRELDKKGYYETDPDGDLVTRCLGGRDCIFAMQESGVYKCAIEKAYLEGKSSYKKPISCHLYPIRLSQVGDYTALNYSRWEICSPACSLGKELKVPVYRFLKEALIRQFGAQWYGELEQVAAEYAASKA